MRQQLLANAHAAWVSPPIVVFITKNSIKNMGQMPVQQHQGTESIWAGKHNVQCQKKSPPEVFCHFFPNGWEFLVQILHAYYTFLSTLDYKFLFNYLQLWLSYAILSATTQFTLYAQYPSSSEMHAFRCLRKSLIALLMVVCGKSSQICCSAFFADRTATLYDRLLPAACCPSVCLSICL